MKRQTHVSMRHVWLRIVLIARSKVLRHAIGALRDGNLTHLRTDVKMQYASWPSAKIAIRVGFGAVIGAIKIIISMQLLASVRTLAAKCRSARSVRVTHVSVKLASRTIGLMSQLISALMRLVSSITAKCATLRAPQSAILA